VHQTDSEQWARQIAIDAAKRWSKTDDVVISETKEGEKTWMFFLAKPFGAAVAVEKGTGKVTFQGAM
jgi:hypothetical protein